MSKTYDFTEKVIVITGATGGVGSALVHALLERGARVAAVDLHDESLQKLKETLQAHDRLSYHAIDITNRDLVMALPEQVVHAHGSVDGVINCAGIIQPFVSVEELDIDAMVRVMDVNFYGTVHMVKAFLPFVKKQPQGCIVNISSMGSYVPVPGQTVYGASKAAVKLFTEGLYSELRDSNVTVSVVLLGATDTGIANNSKVEIPNVNEADRSKFTVLSPINAATQILNGVQKGKVQIFVGRDASSMNLISRLRPIYAMNLIQKKMKSLLS